MRAGKLYGVFVISDDFTLNHWKDILDKKKFVENVIAF